MPDPAPQTLATANDHDRSLISDAGGALAAMPSQPQREDGFPWDNQDRGADWIVELPPLPWDNDKRSLVWSLFSQKGSELQFDSGSGRTVYVGAASNHHLMAVISPPDQRVPSEVRPHNVTLGRHEIVLLCTFQERIHGTFPIICDEVSVEPQQLMQEVVSHPLLLWIVLATAAIALDEDVLMQWCV
ncbi:hypothetical protein BJX68DRAFT_270158 [Aspergillus pseudodeflectus]|uniref:Uncharacterized protein n=1 Tax=Aspergillus pseudodeflectus TaxID=176178 RepID=A0ABR4JTR8_9EURO